MAIGNEAVTLRQFKRAVSGGGGGGAVKLIVNNVNAKFKLMYLDAVSGDVIVATPGTGETVVQTPASSPVLVDNHSVMVTLKSGIAAVLDHSDYATGAYNDFVAEKCIIAPVDSKFTFKNQDSGGGGM